MIKVRVLTDLSTWVDTLKLHFYGAPVAAILDNAALPMLWANRANRLGSIQLSAFTTEGTGSDMAYTLATPGNSDLPLFVSNLESPAARDLWFAIEDLSAGTPASAQSFFIEVSLDAN